jgi:RNA polymerase sigma factor (sigma-70 family)
VEGGGPKKASTFGWRGASYRQRASALSHDSEEATPGGDPGDYGELFEAHHLSAYRLALLISGGEAALAEDAVSEAFALVYTKWRQGGVTDFGAYLRRAVANQVKGTFRRRTVQRREEQRQMAAAPTISTGSFEDRLADKQALSDALRQLPQKQRTAVVLHYYEDRPLEDVADIMGTSIGTAKSHVSRGRDRLRELLEQGQR